MIRFSPTNFKRPVYSLHPKIGTRGQIDHLSRHKGYGGQGCGCMGLSASEGPTRPQPRQFPSVVSGSSLGRPDLACGLVRGLSSIEPCASLRQCPANPLRQGGMTQKNRPCDAGENKVCQKNRPHDTFLQTSFIKSYIRRSHPW